ncbi:MAG: MerR family transcriptional regulator [Actinomycetota bacterium]
MRTERNALQESDLHQIGEVAERTGLSLRTIRYYEEMGLVVPSGRTAGGFRLYTEEDIDRLELVKRLKALDLSLELTSDMLSARDLLATGAARGESEGAIEVIASYVDGAEERLEKLASRLEAARSAVRDLRTEVRRRARAVGASSRK